MLIKYEFLKILRKKSTIIIMAASFILYYIHKVNYKVYSCIGYCLAQKGAGI